MSQAPIADPLIVQDAQEAHLPAIQAIYAHYVLNDLCSFEEVPPTVAQLRARHEEVLRAGGVYLVALRHGVVQGYAYAGAYRGRSAYRRTVENSVYVAPWCRGQGAGRALMAQLVARCTQAGFAQMVAVVGHSGNEGSLRLHRSAGFETVGTLRNVGFKFGRWVDTVLMQRPLADAAR